MFLFTIACREEKINEKIAKQRTYDIWDYEKPNFVTENARTFLKNGEYSKNMNIHAGIYEAEDTKAVLNAEEHINILHT